MSTTGLYSFRISFRQRRPQTKGPFARPDTRDLEGETPDDAASAAAIELLSSLRGVQPDRLRSLVSGDAAARRGTSLQLAFADLPNKLRRR